MVSISSATFIGAASSIIAATIAAAMVVWQIGRQGRYSLEQSHHSERLKLKVGIYREIAGHLRASSAANAALAAQLTSLIVASGWWRDPGRRMKPPPPRQRAEKLIGLWGGVQRHVTDLVFVIESYEIIDPRMSVFRLALGSALYDLDRAWERFGAVAYAVLPHDNAPPDTHLHQEKWDVPQPTASTELGDSAQAVWNVIIDLNGYAHDLQVELQRLLLGDLFSGTLERRKPLDPTKKVISLDEAAPLSRYFREESPSGIYQTEIIRDVQQRFDLPLKDGYGPSAAS